MRTFCIVMTAGCVLTAGVSYIVQVLRRSVEPTLSSWIIYLASVGISLPTYLVAQEKDLASGILNVMDVFMASSVLVTIFFTRGRTTTFRPHERWYLVAAAVILAFWSVSRNAVASNLLAQVLITAGAVPTIHTVWSGKRNTESFVSWGLFGVASIFALYPAITGGKPLAVVYTIRSFLVVATLLGVMGYYTRWPGGRGASS